MALKPEMTRLNDSRVNGTNRHLVNFFAAYLEKIRDTYRNPFTGGTTPRIQTGPIRVVKPHRLQPRMAFRPYGVLLGYFAFEQVRLGNLMSHRFKQIFG
jgi:hypothetical protein